MFDMIAKVTEKWREIWDRSIFLFLFCSFFIVHGEMIFNKISWWDDIAGVLGSGPDFNGPLPHGRWFAFLLGKYLFGIFLDYGSLPVINGIIVSVCIAFFSLIIFSLFNIYNKIHKILLGMIFLSFPCVAGNLGYMGGAGINFIGILLCLIAAVFACESIFKGSKINNIKYCLGAFLFGCSLGEYQCYFSLYLTVCFLYFVNYVVQHNISFKMFYVFIGKLGLNVFMGTLMYLVFLKIFLWFADVKLLSYANTDTYGIVSFEGYLERLKVAYIIFFYPSLHSFSNMFPFTWSGWYVILLLLITMLGGCLLISNYSQGKKRTNFQLYLLILMTPLVFNFNIFLYGWGPLHSLHVYQQSLLFLLPIIFYQALAKGYKRCICIRFAQFNIVAIFHKLIVSFMIAFTFLYIGYDNYCYMLSELRLSQAISYYNTLVSRITSAQGYKAEYPVAFINETQKKSNIGEIMGGYPYPATNPYCNQFINSYKESSRAFMKYWCGYEPKFVDAKLYEQNKIVQSMPSYPDDGSIKIMNQVIIIKF